MTKVVLTWRGVTANLLAISGDARLGAEHSTAPRDGQAYGWIMIRPRLGEEGHYVAAAA